eukprot:582299-Amphidinium_carterae.1
MFARELVSTPVTPPVGWLRCSQSQANSKSLICVLSTIGNPCPTPISEKFNLGGFGSRLREDEDFTDADVLVDSAADIDFT